MIETDWQIIWIRQTHLCSCDSLKIHGRITGQTAKLTPATGWPSSKWTYCGTSTGAQSNEALRAGCWMSTATDVGDVKQMEIYGNVRKWMEITSAWPLRVTSAFHAATMEASTNPRFSSRTDLQELQTQMKKAAVVKFSFCVCRHMSPMCTVNICQWCIPFSWSAMELDALGHSHDSLRPGTIRSSRSFADAGHETDKTARNRYDMLVLHGVEWDCSRLYGVFSMACKNLTSNLPWEQCSLSFSRTQISTTMTTVACLGVSHFFLQVDWVLTCLWV